jgi:glycosyltransferase involved in cell wall biosynthesis
VKKELPFFKIIIAGKGNLGFQPSAFDDSIFDIKNDYINNETLVSYIQKSSLIVLPYTDATQSAVLMTAFAFDKPVIATSVGGIPELVENNITGILVPPRDHKKLAAAILDLLKNPAKREAISLNIMQKFSQGSFSWNSITDKIIGVYKKAISAH